MALSISAAVAAPLFPSPVPDNATMTYNGLQWAWGGACAYSGCGFAGGDLTYQGTQGWRLPTATELGWVDTYDAVDASAFSQLFFYPGANVPANGSDPVTGANFNFANPSAGACASPYFENDGITHCDYGDGLTGSWYGTVRGGLSSTSEQLYVRTAAAGPVTAVPEPLTMSIFGAGLAGAAALRRRKKKAA